MTIIYPNATPAKSRRFGAGILPSYPTRRLPITEADRQWWAEESNRDATDYDLLATAAEQGQKYDAGFLPL